LSPGRYRLARKRLDAVWRPAGNATLAITVGERVSIRFTASKRIHHTPTLRRQVKHAQKQLRHFIYFCLI
jgi:hypothetical protein